MTKNPLVSCLMVTRCKADRRVFIRANLRSFAKQTHKNKELVVILDRVKPADERWFRSVCRQLKIAPYTLSVKKKVTLGELRNLSMDHARGQVGIQWDDDDFFHPKRIERQLVALRLQKADAVILIQCCHLFANEKTVSISDWSTWRLGGLSNTLMQRLPQPLRYPSSNRHEDTVFLDRLNIVMKVVRLQADPENYIYVAHGKNVSTTWHHRWLRGRMAASVKNAAMTEKKINNLLKLLGAAKAKLIQLEK